MSRPSTDGCTEQSCMYHGGDNRFKAAHEEGCPVRDDPRPLAPVFDNAVDYPRCECKMRLG